MTHLSLDDREIIESSLKQKLTFTQIASLIGKHRTTVSKEILNHRFNKQPNTYGRNFVYCSLEQECHHYHGVGCTRKCKNFKPLCCPSLEHPPYVCNACSKRSNCALQKFYYRAKSAHDEYLSFLSEARQGIRLSNDTIQQIDSVISPLIRDNKQSVNQVYINHPDLLFFSKTQFYHLIDLGVFSFCNLDLPRRVKYKLHKDSKPRRTRAESLIRVGRTYKDYCSFIKSHNDHELSIVQMDTVEGVKGGKCFLTLLFVQYNLMLIYLLNSKTMECVSSTFDWIKKTIGLDEFKRLFEVILTDNGSEFFDPDHIEKDCDTHEFVSHVFYCDPSASYQKGAIEKNHQYIRYILPKGTSFDTLTQQDCKVLMSHINSVPRDSLRGKTPYSEVLYFIDKQTLRKLGVSFIKPDEVSLATNLLKKKDKI